MDKNKIGSDIAKTKHDVFNSFRTLQLIIEEIERGYRFDDKDAPEILHLFKRSVQTLNHYFSERL